MTKPSTAERFQELLKDLKKPRSIQDFREIQKPFAPLFNEDPPKVGRVLEGVRFRRVGGEELHTDLLIPEGKGPHPILLLIHGGGWVMGCAANMRKLGLRFVERGFLVVIPDYRLAPEYPFPAAYEDCKQCLRWAFENALGFGGDPSRIIIGGDSAGANLAAAVATAEPLPSGLSLGGSLLLYGIYDLRGLDRQLQTMGGVFTNPELLHMMADAYAGGKATEAWAKDPRVSPLPFAHRLPPSLLVCGSMDPFLPQSEELFRSLETRKGKDRLIVAPGMPHAFAQMEFLPGVLDVIDEMARFSLGVLKTSTKTERRDG
jgi:acetyl esterase